MELQLNTVPPKVSSQESCVPKGEEVAARRLSVAQTGTGKCRLATRVGVANLTFLKIYVIIELIP